MYFNCPTNIAIMILALVVVVSVLVVVRVYKAEAL
jgi:hypothetical protein